LATTEGRSREYQYATTWCGGNDEVLSRVKRWAGDEGQRRKGTVIRGGEGLSVGTGGHVPINQGKAMWGQTAFGGKGKKKGNVLSKGKSSNRGKGSRAISSREKDICQNWGNTS